MPNYYQVSVLAEHLSVGLKEQVQIRLPKRCPCCAGDVSPNEYLPEISFARPDVMGPYRYNKRRWQMEPSRYTVYRWRFPCCAQCARHIKVAAHPPSGSGGFLFTLGIIFIPLMLVLLGVFVNNGSAVGTAIGIAVGVAAVILIPVGSRRSRRYADEAIKQAMTDNCCSSAEPVRYVDVRESSDLAYKRDSGGADFIVGPDGVVIAAESPRPHDLHDNDTPRCCNMHVFEFRNRMYAEFFAEANGVQMQEVTEPAKVGHIALGKAC